MANNNDAFIPELWANESVAILEENMVAAKLVHRDFQNELQSFGDLVHTRQPAEFTALAKTDSDDVTDQDASATNIQIPLDQHIHVSYVIKDGERSKSFKDLVATYMHPAALAMARRADQLVLGQVYQFLANRAGTLGGASSSTIKGYMLDAREVMNRNKAPLTTRNLIVTPQTETEMLKLDLFIAANTVGDDGSALRRALLGTKLGWDIYMCQNMSEIATGNSTDVTMLINNSAGYPAGTVTMTVDGITGAVNVGDWIVIGNTAAGVAGDDTPLLITAHTETSNNTTSITVQAPGLSSAVVNNAVITRFTPGAINNAAGYAAGWNKAMVVDGFTVAPKVGQVITLGVDATKLTKYVVIAATTTSLTLDRPLEYAVVDDAVVHPGPSSQLTGALSGSYNFGFHKNAIAFVNRPLAPPMEGTGARSAIANYQGVSMRVTMQYDSKSQGLRVTHDFLCGVKTLDTDLGVVMFG